MWFKLTFHVMHLKEPCDLVIVTLKVAEKFVGVAVYLLVRAVLESGTILLSVVPFGSEYENKIKLV